MLLKKHKNELLALIKESDLAPTLFASDYQTIAKEKFFVMQLLNSPLRFMLRPTRGFDVFEFYQSDFSPNFPLRGPYTDHTTQNIHARFNHWLNTVVKPYLDEAITPDLWQTLQDTRSEAMPEIESQPDLEPFSEEEKKQLKLSIDQLRLSIKNSFNLQEKQLATINKLLQHLSNAVDKHNRFDWRGIAINVAVTIALHLTLNPDETRQLFQLFNQALSNIIRLLP